MRETVLEISGLMLRRGPRDVLRGVDLRAERGELVALMGLSGGGKTTVLRAIAGLEAFEGGSIQLEDVRLRPGRIPDGAVAKALRRNVGLVFQLHHLFEHLTALHNVWLAPVHVQGEGRASAAGRAQQLLDQLGVGHRAGALPRELSGGEAQRVAIARALAMDPPLLLMDEPTASLDPARRGELGETLRGLTKAGRTLLIATHDYDFARAYATRVMILAEGRVVEEGMPEQVLRNPRHPATRALLAANRGIEGAGPSRT
jgi:ABC-type polar amino acid transport system ATPase subunit